MAVVCLVLGVLAAIPAASRADVPQAPVPIDVIHTPDTRAVPRSLLANVTFDPPDPDKDSQAEPPTGQRRRANTGRAMLEMGGFLSYSASNYWRKYASFIEDWQFKLTWRDQTRKWFTSEGLRLDSNNFRLNWTHGAAGALYYSFARSNGFGPGGSFLFAAGGSLLWEYGAEWREISSINDHVYTAIGSVPIAESLFQVSNHFRNRHGLANRLGELATNPLVAINDLLDGKGRPPRVATDQWHDFRLSTGGLRGAPLADSDAATQNVLSLDLRTVTLPGYGKAGTGSGRTDGTIDSGFHFDAKALGLNVEEFSISARTTLLGWWWRDIRQDGQGLRHGHDLWLGAQVAWDMVQKIPVAPYDGHDLGMKDKWLPREQPTRFTDKLSSVHFPGPTVSLTTYAGRLRTRIDLGAALNFSMVNSLPFNQYSATHSTWGSKTTLHNWGYYYALGTTLIGHAEAEMGVWRATADADYRRFASIQGLDRYQGDITDDSRLTDSRLVSAASVSVRIPRTPVFGMLKVEGIDRRGRFHEIAAHTHEARFSYEIGVCF
ncbi:MAG: DUF3943 domain-containing protein [Acidobacteria bacterium]|nr:DUF3943 domain-containing protein [Acidobacteriota bacterium]